MAVAKGPWSDEASQALKEAFLDHAVLSEMIAKPSAMWVTLFGKAMPKLLALRPGSSAEKMQERIKKMAEVDKEVWDAWARKCFLFFFSF